MQKLTEFPGYSKVYGSNGSGVIINHDSNALTSYKRQKNAQARLDKLENDVGELRTDIKAILALLTTK